jgi:cell division protein FtsI/penicillin-binding protein 2
MAGLRLSVRHFLNRRPPLSDRRILVLQVAVILGLTVIAGRLFILQVLSHDFYSALASDQHGIFERLFPERGTIYLQDPKAPDSRFPAAVNKSLTLIYADDRQIEEPASAARKLAPILEMDEQELAVKLSGGSDPYVPLKKKLPEEIAEQVRALNIPGIAFVREQFRFYPERSSTAHVLGFVGATEAGDRVGRYGIEGYWNKELTGEQGYLETERDPVGRWIGAADRNFRPAVNGVELTLTIDRNIQYIACEKLRQAVSRHGASGGSVIILDPKTGAIIAMCGMPDYDPNDFSAVENMNVFNNPATFYAYEPGSVFKSVTMASAIDAGKVMPNTVYNDEGSVTIGDFTIRNSDEKANGLQTMTQVLEKSLNTGAIFAVRQLGSQAFLKYVRDFGFGQPAGLELESEAPGNISSLEKKGDIWSATASFGQGITVTPLQLAAAYAALANGGKLMKPYIVAEVVHGDGSVTRTEPTVVRQVVTKRAATLVGGMLVKVVESGHGKRAGVPGYYVAGKTGTAQISRGGTQGYEKDAFIGSFIGFAPVDDPAFVMAVRIDRPKDVQFAESSAAPLFGEIAAFLLQYMQIPPDRPLLK